MAKAANVVTIPSAALVVLIGVAGSGKSTFANERFRATEILSSDHFRAVLSDDEGDQEATNDAFTLLHLILERRLKRGLLCVVDATNLMPEYRSKLIKIARLFNRPAVALIFDTPLDDCLKRAGGRLDRVVSAAVIREQWDKLAPQTDEGILKEGFRKVTHIHPSNRPEIRRTASRAATSAAHA